jgi:hypothetical protein
MCQNSNANKHINTLTPSDGVRVGNGCGDAVAYAIGFGIVY